MPGPDFKPKNRFNSAATSPYNDRVGGDAVIKHIDSELQGLKDLTLQMGGCVEKAFEGASQSILGKDQKCHDDIDKHEARINDLQILIDESCVNVLAKQAPVAKDLRLVFAITKINTDLERMGDQCVNISHSTKEIFKSWPSANHPAKLRQMLDETRGMMRSVLDAFARRDVELSRKVLKQDDLIDDLKDSLVEDMTEEMKNKPGQIELCLAYIMIAKNLERLADHATNIAEEVIYLATGTDVRHGNTASSANS
jgi:phosphate transport system protein